MHPTMLLWTADQHHAIRISLWLPRVKPDGVQAVITSLGLQFMQNASLSQQKHVLQQGETKTTPDMMEKAEEKWPTVESDDSDVIPPFRDVELTHNPKLSGSHSTITKSRDTSSSTERKMSMFMTSSFKESFAHQLEKQVMVQNDPHDIICA